MAGQFPMESDLLVYSSYPLLTQVLRNNIPGLKKALKKKVDINDISSSGDSALKIAARSDMPWLSYC